MIIVHLGWNLVRERIKWRHRVALFIVTLTDETQVSNQRQNFRCTYEGLHMNKTNTKKTGSKWRIIE